MPRIVKEYAVRRDEILDSAQRLVYNKGYEHMAIQDILDELQIAKGTFYHYFGSKQTLLEALVERLLNEGERVFLPIVDDPCLSALEKLQRMFDAIGRWKSAQKTYHLALLRVWYSDENAIARWKVRVMRVTLMRPLLTRIIRQGIQEGTISTPYPDQTGEVVLSLLQEFMDTLAGLFLASEPERSDLDTMVRTVAAYTDGLERVLGVPGGSLSLVDSETLREWLDALV